VGGKLARIVALVMAGLLEQFAKLERESLAG
jgi:hypothetical protein